MKPTTHLNKSKNNIISKVGRYLEYIYSYRLIIKNNVKNDLKGRFKYTFLGYFWHVLNPLTQIVIYVAIFSMLFGRGVSNYWIYISSGMFVFIFSMSCISGGCNYIVGNSRLVTKISIPREIIIIWKVTTEYVTSLISYTILAILIAILGFEISIGVLLMPLILGLLAIFCMGIAFIFSSLTVYVRDLANVVRLLMGCMMFALPIMYFAEQRSTPLIEIFWSINPLYYYVELFHEIYYWASMPDLLYLSIIFIVSPISFIIGLLIFKKLEMGFAERL